MSENTTSGNAQAGDNTHRGGCLCGRVRFEVDLHEPGFHACHCTVCQGWGGLAMAAPAAAIRIADNRTVRHFSSSEHAQRAFCSECGSHLYWRMKDESYLAVMIGLLDDSTGLQFDTQLFIDEKPGHYEFANDNTCMTAADVMEQFADANADS